ncbi:MAG TPA: FecR domain-containing protein, partial [Dissulfurispiraceae bacterium]|nr:FecR domain-containing protein [Dissulfurispiraceae bacterium]
MKKIGSVLSLILIVMCVFSSPSPGEETVEVVVTKGDTLVAICEKHLENPGKWAEIAHINRLRDPDMIHPGMRLIIPVRLLKGLPVEGRFTLVHGDVKVQNESAGDWAVVQIGDTVRQGSSISTGADSAAEVTFENGDMMLLRSETNLGVQSIQKRGSSHFFSDLMVRAGRVISDIKRATGSDSRFRIRTPSSLTSVRGTDFRVSNDAEDTARTEVLSGEVHV